MYFERRVVYETWELLEDIDKSIPMHWVWGGRSGRQGNQSVLAQTTFRRKLNSTNDYHSHVGHLVSTTEYTSHALLTYVCSSLRRPRICLVCRNFQWESQ